MMHHSLVILNELVYFEDNIFCVLVTEHSLLSRVLFFFRYAPLSHPASDLVIEIRSTSRVLLANMLMRDDLAEVLIN